MPKHVVGDVSVEAGRGSLVDGRGERGDERRAVRLRIAFSDDPAPHSPTWMTVEPSICNTGSALRRAAVSPLAKMVSSPRRA